MLAERTFKMNEDPLQAFQKLNEFIYLHKPLPSTSPDSTGASPRLVILCSWIFAQPRHISKYLRHYQEQYPAAQILLIQVDKGNLIWRPDQWQLPMFDPAILVIDEHLRTTSKPSVLLHVFSNGGSYTAVQLAKAYRRTAIPSSSEKPHELPVNAIVFDSCPSPPRLALGIKAMSMGLPRSGIARWLGVSMVSIALLILAALHELHIAEMPLVIAYRELNTLPFLQGDVPRSYIYSKTDAVMGEQDILDHAQAARTKLIISSDDVRVRTEEFAGSQHVNHMAVDIERYWKIVRDTWDQAVKLQQAV